MILFVIDRQPVPSLAATEIWHLLPTRTNGTPHLTTWFVTCPFGVKER